MLLIQSDLLSVQFKSKTHHSWGDTTQLSHQASVSSCWIHAENSEFEQSQGTYKILTVKLQNSETPSIQTISFFITAKPGNSTQLYLCTNARVQIRFVCCFALLLVLKKNRESFELKCSSAVTETSHIKIALDNRKASLCSSSLK